MTADQICDEYDAKQLLYKEFCQSIAEIIRQVLLTADIKTYGITYREKDPQKLRDKILRKKKSGTEYTSLDDIEDLSGIRVVTYLDSQKDVVVRLICKEFETANPRVEKKLDPKGYRGTHIVLRLDQQL